MGKERFISTYLHFSSLSPVCRTPYRTPGLEEPLRLSKFFFFLFQLCLICGTTPRKATDTAFPAIENKNRRTFHFPLICFAFINSERQWIWSSIFWRTSKLSQNILQRKPWGDGDLPSLSSEIDDGGSEMLQISINALRPRKRSSKSRFDFLILSILKLFESHDSYSYSRFQSSQCGFLFFLFLVCLAAEKMLEK